MKKIQKYLMIMILCFIVIFLSTAVASAAIIKPQNSGMSFVMPDSLYVFTAGFDEADPKIEYLGLTAGYLRDNFENNDMCLVAYPDDASYAVFVKCYSLTNLQDFNRNTKSGLESIGREWQESGKTDSFLGVYEHKQVSFIKSLYTQPYNTVEYCTVVQDTCIEISLVCAKSGISSQMEDVLKSVVDGASFDNASSANRETQAVIRFESLTDFATLLAADAIIVFAAFIVPIIFCKIFFWKDRIGKRRAWAISALYAVVIVSAMFFVTMFAGIGFFGASAVPCMFVSTVIIGIKPKMRVAANKEPQVPILNKDAVTDVTVKASEMPEPAIPAGTPVPQLNYDRAAYAQYLPQQVAPPRQLPAQPYSEPPFQYYGAPPAQRGQNARLAYQMPLQHLENAQLFSKTQSGFANTTNTAQFAPVQITQPVSFKAPQPEPARAPQPEPFKAPQPEPLKTPQPEPLKAPQLDPAQAPQTLSNDKNKAIIKHTQSIMGEFIPKESGLSAQSIMSEFIPAKEIKQPADFEPKKAIEKIPVVRVENTMQETVNPPSEKQEVQETKNKEIKPVPLLPRTMPDVSDGNEQTKVTIREDVILEVVGMARKKKEMMAILKNKPSDNPIHPGVRYCAMCGSRFSFSEMCCPNCGTKTP